MCVCSGVRVRALACVCVCKAVCYMCMELFVGVNMHGDMCM